MFPTLNNALEIDVQLPKLQQSELSTWHKHFHNLEPDECPFEIREPRGLESIPVYLVDTALLKSLPQALQVGLYIADIMRLDFVPCERHCHKKCPDKCPGC